ncbi:MAG: glutamate--tRNA ligase, partial [candidate division Zixibacteria bacterium]|nr:glutamate--tRNA ligase [candidate division Zixibacteria bacterium]
PEFLTMGTYFFTFNGVYEPEAESQYFDTESAVLLEILADRFQGLAGFTLENTERTLEALATENGIEKASIIHPTRLAVSGVSRGPGLFEMLVTLGQPVVVDRLRQAVKHIRDKN